ncbi:hypothetical protein BJF93_01895 [Xaviernesmea oryzae]|uniref:YdhG-like domain-containing protein n=1 Tax=Xaviernesmea oryzae TaxID=464029 RepID=A0A1Q9B3E0_9HYPH|nr:DUF1801 domain-containing protein [Xaviernesmea oryzae]OLP62568.1 hypothetical protein BJF93_01895 [Xaviernesmea oryzae]SEM19240.1 protein of unknown function (DU1801) [Xaviernesmea oryzae]
MADPVGTFEQVIALEPQHEALVRALRALASELHPDRIEVSRPGDRAVSWGWGPKKMSEAYACALPYKDHVNLAFYRGATLADPAGKLRGSGKAMRHMSLTRVDQLNDQAVRDLLVAAREERRQALRLTD